MKRLFTIRPLLCALVALSLLLPGLGAGTARAYDTISADGIQKLAEQNKGKVTLCIFWATWCPACRQELPELRKLRDLYSADQLDIVAISLDDSSAPVEQYFAADPAPFPVYVGGEDVGPTFRISAIPHVLVYDREGKQYFSRPGAYPVAMLQVMVDNLLGEK